MHSANHTMLVILYELWFGLRLEFTVNNNYVSFKCKALLLKTKTVANVTAYLQSKFYYVEIILI